MKASLVFTLPEESSEFETAVKASDMKVALWGIGQEIFRPARKHGYNDHRIQQLLELIDDKMGQDNPGATELIGMLEQMFYDIINERNIDLD